MKHKTFTLTAAAILSTGTAMAAPVDALSELRMSHGWRVSNGAYPMGLEVGYVAQSLVIDTNIGTTIDDPTADEVVISTFDIGNPFTDPPTPVQSQRVNSTTVDGRPDFATASLNYSIEVEDNPQNAVFDPIRRDINQYGYAQVNMEDNTVAGSAMSSHVGARDHRFTNTTNDRISFNLNGEFEADLIASIDGGPGTARTSGGFSLLFQDAPGASVNYFAIAPYLSTTTDTDPGAFVTDLYLTNSGGITGVNFSASTTAIGDGGLTEAAFSANSRYIFGITLDAGASLVMETDFRQSNGVFIEPAMAVPPVPLPASLPMFLAGLAGLGLLGCKRVTRAQGRRS